MARRTKHEMEQMKSDARFYLIRTNNQPLAAFELMVKECLETGESIPYYIKDNKDFLKVSQELALELNRVDQMAKGDREQAMAKQSVINYIMNLSVNEIKSIYKKYKDNVTQSNKLILNETYMMIYSNDMKEAYINQATINLFSNIIEQENNVEEEIAGTIEEDESSNNNEDNQVNEQTHSFSYTITDNYIPQPLSGTINASDKKEAYNLLCDIYTDELGVSESDLEIALKDVNQKEVNIMKLTFKLDCQLNSKGDYIPAGTEVSLVANINESYLTKQLSKGNIPVIIDHAYNSKGKRIKLNPVTEWFMSTSFIESI